MGEGKKKVFSKVEDSDDIDEDKNREAEFNMERRVGIGNHED